MNRTAGGWLGLAASLWYAAAARADGAAEVPQVALPDMGGMAVRLVIALVLVVGLILVLQRLARRFGQSMGRGHREDQIQILGQRALGPRLSLTLVRVLDRDILLGVSPQGIRAVADLGTSSSPLRVAADPGASSSALRAVADPGAPSLAAGALDAPEKLTAGAFPFEPAATGFARGGAGDAGPAGPGVPPGPGSPRPAKATGFEGELRGRLEALQRRYPRLTDLDRGGAGPRP